MPNLPNNNSFIPKQGPEKRTRKTASRQIHIFTVFSYILFFSTLSASVGVIFYGRFMDDKLQKAVADLNTEIEGFNTATMDEVREFDSKLKQTQNRINSAVSVRSIFAALEASTAQSVKITDLKLVRNFDTDYSLTAEIETDSFDSSIFQRSTFSGNEIVNDLEINNVEIMSESDDESDNLNQQNKIRFTAEINVPISSIPFKPTASLPASTPVVSAENSADSDPLQESEESVEDNNNDI